MNPETNSEQRPEAAEELTINQAVQIIEELGLHDTVLRDKTIQLVRDGVKTPQEGVETAKRRRITEDQADAHYGKKPAQKGKK